MTKKSQPTTMPAKKVEYPIICPVDQDQLNRDSHTMAENHMRILELKDEAKEAADNFKSMIKPLEAENKIMAQRISSGNETRMLECEWRYNEPGPGSKQLYRLDGDEPVFVKQEAMEPEECQMELDLQQGKSETNPESGDLDNVDKTVAATEKAADYEGPDNSGGTERVAEDEPTEEQQENPVLE